MTRLGIGGFIVVVALVLGVFVSKWWLRVVVAPPPPKSNVTPFVMPTTSSHLSLAASLPRPSILSQLEAAIPKQQKFDVTQNGLRVYGTPSRGPISVTIDAPGKRVLFSMPVSGHIQAEKRIKINLLVAHIDKLASVGLNFSAHGSASLSPVIAPNWTIDPQLELSAHADKVTASIPLIGNIDITGHVQGGVASALNGAKAAVEAKLKEMLDVRNTVEGLWNKINTVSEVEDTPPTWLCLTPKRVAFGQFQYTNDAINSGLALDLDTNVFVQDASPPILKSPLPDLQLNAPLSDDLDVSLPIEVSNTVINEQLQAQLTTKPIKLPHDVSVKLSNVSLASYGEGILLTLDFSASKGWLTSAAGRLYVVGVPVLDAAKSELRVDKLAFTVDTEDILVNSVNWLAHDKLLDEMQSAAVVNLGSELKNATAQANTKLSKLEGQLPKELGASVSITTINIKGLVFSKEQAFALITAKGKMSAQLKP